MTEAEIAAAAVAGQEGVVVDPMKGNVPPPERFDAIIRQKNDALAREEAANSERDFYKQQYEQSIAQQGQQGQDEYVQQEELPFLTTVQFQQYTAQQEQEKQEQATKSLWNNLQQTVTRTVAENPYINRDALELSFLKQPELLEPENLSSFLEDQKKIYLGQRQVIIDEYESSRGQKPPISSGRVSATELPPLTSFAELKERLASRFMS